MDLIKNEVYNEMTITALSSLTFTMYTLQRKRKYGHQIQSVHLNLLFDEIELRDNEIRDIRAFLTFNTFTARPY